MLGYHCALPWSLNIPRYETSLEHENGLYMYINIYIYIYKLMHYIWLCISDVLRASNNVAVCRIGQADNSGLIWHWRVWRGSYWETVSTIFSRITRIIYIYTHYFLIYICEIFYVILYFGRSKCEASAGHRVILYQYGCSKGFQQRCCFRNRSGG